MLKLPDQVRKNKFLYKKVKRVDNVAMFDQYMIERSRSIKVGTEVFVVRIQKKIKMPNGKIIPEKEKFPSNEDFGKYAWSIPDRKKAEKKFNELLNGSIKSTTKKNTKTINLNNNVVIKCFSNKSVMVMVNKKPVGPKPYLIEALVKKKNYRKETASKMKIKEITKILFKE